MLLNMYDAQNSASLQQERITQPQMSTVPRLRIPAPDLHLVVASGHARLCLTAGN